MMMRVVNTANNQTDTDRQMNKQEREKKTELENSPLKEKKLIEKAEKNRGK